MKKIGLVLFILVSLAMLIGCTENTRIEGNEITAKEINGVQVAELSWGKFNYDPGTIHVKANQPVEIVADLNRLTGCYRSFVVPGLGISTTFSQRQNTYHFTPTQKGTYAFTCTMGMGSGNLVVE